MSGGMLSDMFRRELIAIFDGKKRELRVKWSCPSGHQHETRAEAEACIDALAREVLENRAPEVATEGTIVDGGEGYLRPIADIDFDPYVERQPSPDSPKLSEKMIEFGRNLYGQCPALRELMEKAARVDGELSVPVEGNFTRAEGEEAIRNLEKALQITEEDRVMAAVREIARGS